MTYSKVFFTLIILRAGCSFSETLPEIFDNAPLISFPISVQRISYNRIFISSPSSVDVRWGGPENIEHYESIQQLHSYFLKNSRTNLLSLQNSQWSQDKEANEKPVQSWRIGKLPCSGAVSCYLLSANQGCWIVVSKGREVTDFELVSAVQNEYDEKGEYKGRVASLDTTFGDGAVFQQLPITDFENTGIFCSSITYGQTQSIHFKRRITSEGKVENKEIDGGYTQCKAPW